MLMLILGAKVRVIDTKSRGGGHSLKIGDGDVRQTRPPLSDRMSPNDPLFISLISLSRNDPHNFENVLSLNDPLFEKYMLSTE